MSYFKYPTPTPIHGEPTNKAPKQLKNELRANASSVETNLGDGDYGYLGIVLTYAEYACVSSTPFVAPNYPIELTVPPLATTMNTVHLQDWYVDRVYLYRECTHVEKALLRHVQSAVEEMYLES